MRHTRKKIVLDACKLSFEGKTHAEIAKILDVNVSAIWKWRKTPLWQEFEKELIEAHKQSLLGAQSTTLSEG